MPTDRRARVNGMLARAARTASFCVLVSAVLGAAVARQVRADMIETSSASTAILAELVDLPQLGSGLTRLSVNGERVDVAAAVVPGSVDEVVRGIERSCRAGVEGMPDGPAPASGPARLDLVAVLLDAARSTTTRDGDTTTVVCVADTAATRDVGLRERLAELSRTRDLAALGSLRHFTVSPVATGTRVIAAWLPGRFPLDRVFPESGDAPGGSLETIPRPASARLLLTAGAEGQPHVIRVFEVAGAVEEEVTRDYHARLGQAGFRAAVGDGRVPRAGAVYSLGDVDLLVQLRSDARTDRVFVSTIEMRPPRAEK